MPPSIVSVYIACRPKNCWVARLAKAFRNINVRVVEHSTQQANWHHQLFRITAGDHAQQVARFLQNEPSLQRLQVVMGRNTHIFGYAMSLCGGCGLELAEDCIVRSVSSTKDGSVIWHVIGIGENVRSFMNMLVNRDIAFKIVRQQTLRWNGILTHRQEMVLTTALENGYFDYPRRVGVRTLAAQLGISPSTVLETLRKGLKKVVREYMMMLGVSELTELA
ncbi:MAG: helix-turn-helix domain-containing protein [Candidatus Caldarchaeum sp.]